jgi:hypothetical protein
MNISYAGGYENVRKFFLFQKGLPRESNARGPTLAEV